MLRAKQQGKRTGKRQHSHYSQGHTEAGETQGSGPGEPEEKAHSLAGPGRAQGDLPVKTRRGSQVGLGMN